MFKRLASRFKQMKGANADDSPQEDYRGFVTSITDLKDAQTDACALVCCGVLQSDRDRYFVTGISPPSLARRIFIHIATPLILFVLACYGATHISDPYVNQLTSTLLVTFMFLLVVLQVCFKNRWKRVEVRRELLFRKYHRSIATKSELRFLPQRSWWRAEYGAWKSGINLYARWLLWLKTKDNSGSYRAYRVSKLRELDLNRVRAKGYAFQEEILYRCRRVQCRMEETPIIFEDRRLGLSKINYKETLAALWVIFRLAIDNVTGVSVRA